jgi:hypothetical protein
MQLTAPKADLSTSVEFKMLGKDSYEGLSNYLQNLEQTLYIAVVLL